MLDNGLKYDIKSVYMVSERLAEIDARLAGLKAYSGVGDGNAATRAADARDIAELERRREALVGPRQLASGATVSQPSIPAGGIFETRTHLRDSVAARLGRESIPVHRPEDGLAARLAAVRNNGSSGRNGSGGHQPGR